MSDELTVGLNSEQVRAVKQVNGPLLILAGAGSGKTKTLTHRMAYLLATTDTKPQEILAVTFTNKAANEMRERVAKLLGQNSAHRMFMPFLGTFHGVCVKLLRVDGANIGIPSNFVIFDEADHLNAIKQAMKNLKIEEKSYPARSISSIISSSKNEMIDPETYATLASGQLQRVAASVFPEYESILKQAHGLDFDDLLLKTVQLLRSDNEVKLKWQKQFKYIMVDEYQDTNQAQYELIKLLLGKQKNIAVVGDDWQCLMPGSLIETKEGSRKIEAIKKGYLVKSASGYGNTGYFKVESQKKFAYKGDVIRIKTASGKELVCTPNHLLFARWEKTDSYFVYLMYSSEKGYRIGLAKGTRFDGKKDDIGLRVRANQERADRMWIIKVCKDKDEAIYTESLYAYKYGIPMLVFHAFANRSMYISQKHIDAIYSEIDTEERAKKLMTELGLAFEYPHFLPQATSRKNRKRVVINVVLFGDKRLAGQGGWSASRISVNTTSKKDLKLFEDLGYTIRAGRAGTFRTEISNLDYGKIEQIVEKIKQGKTEETILIKYSFLTNKKFYFMPAGQIHQEMDIPVLEGDKIVTDKVVEVTKQTYSGFVYDLDIEKVHTYLVSGIAVHNSIYSWRGADFRNILKFEQDFPGAQIIKLEQNYRSTKSILDAAHSVISKNQKRSEKKLWTSEGSGKPVHIVQYSSESEEAEAIVTRIRALADAKLNNYADFAILYRINAQSRALEEAFIRYAVPYRIVGGLRFYDRKEIKDIIAYLRLIYQPEDRISFERIVNVPTRGIGAKSLSDFFIWQHQNKLSLSEALNRADKHPSLTTKAKTGLGELADILSSLKQYSEEAPLNSLIDSLVRRVDYYAFLSDGTIQGESRTQNVQELLSVTKEYLSSDLGEFLEGVSLISKLEMAQTQEDSVTLMTMHAAKGLEFPTVFMVGMEETIFPSSRSLYDQENLEEERRLCYVGMTRAKKELYLSYATSRLLYGSVQHNPPSRFLSDMEAEFETSPNQYDLDQNSEKLTSHAYEDEVRYEIEVSEGDLVNHKIFGPGEVIEVAGDRVVVHFKKGGLKNLSLAFAPFDKLI